MLECVVNVSEGRDASVIAALAEAAGPSVLDVHADADHHRSVVTLAGPGVEGAARRLARVAVQRIDLRVHRGAHPRMGSVDVVPFVALPGSSFAEARLARDHFARWAADQLGLPCFLYGAERTLPAVRRHAFAGLAPDTGPDRPHPTAGAVAVGARGLLVAFNLWLAPGVGLDEAREVARAIRGPGIRAIGVGAGAGVQVSCNLIEPLAVGPDAAFDAVAARVEVARAEVVGLVPAGVLAAIPDARWGQLDLHPSRTIEARLLQAGFDGGSSPNAGRGGR